MRLPGRDLAPLLATLLLLAALGAALFALVPVRTGLAEFLPPGHTRASAFLVNELRSGTATSLLLAGIEGAPPAELARLSRATGAALRASDRFAFVGDGTTTLGDSEQALLFRHRYLLSPDTRPETFETPALRAKLESLLDGLRTAASPLLARFGFADPTGAFLGLAQGFLSESRVETRDGAWFAAGDGPPRALLLARTRGAGLDAEAQAAAVAAFRAAFAAAEPGGARLLLSGPGVFAAEAAAAIRGDVRMTTALSCVLLAAFLLWRTRSLLPLLAAAVPLGAGMLAGVAVVALAFGSVHAIALGFGSTMLGVAVDYPILLTALRRPGEALPEAAVRVWPTLRLAAAAAVAGLAAMVGSGFPGLVQLGLFAGAGLVAAALATRWLLPRLLPSLPTETRPLPAVLARPLLALAGHRRGALAVVAAAGLLLAALGGPRWQRDLAALSPVPAAAQALDAELRRQLGAPDVRFLVAIGPTADQAAVLRTAERLRAAVAPLIARGALAGLDEPSRYLPSPDTQRARQAALPDSGALEARLREAAAGLPFRSTAFAPFLAAMAESRALPPLDAGALADAAPTVAARLSPLLSRRGDDAWQGLAVATGVADPAALAEAVASLGEPDVLFLDTKGETEGLLDAYARSTALWTLGGGALVLALLAAGLGGARPALLAAAPIAGGVVVTLAVLAALGEALTLFHLASLLLLAGVAIDYALFLGRSSGAGPEEAGRSMGAVLNCAVCTLLTFGLLAFCDTPILHGIGLTVATGVAAAFLLSCALVSPSPAATPEGLSA